MNPPTEPSADIRQLANAWWQIYSALLSEGFTEAQALRLLGYVMAASSGTGDEG